MHIMKLFWHNHLVWAFSARSSVGTGAVWLWLRK